MGSIMYNRHFTHGNCDFLGKTVRHSVLKSKEVRNSSFEKFSGERGLSIPGAYRMVSPNLEASFKSIAKYDKAQPVVDEPAWVQAGVWTEEHFRKVMGGAEVLDQETVLQEMDKTTSCGYPWNRQFKDKREFLDNPKAALALEDFWEQLVLPEMETIPIWTCAQKIELRALEKLAENNVRTFTASPIEHATSMNRLCLDMNNGFYSGAARTWSFVGISKFMGGWDSLYRRLDKHPNAFELDESQYDSSLFAKAMFGQRDLRWSMLRNSDQTPKNWLRLSRLYDSVVNSVIVLENGDLIQKHTGNPSGSTNTIVDNTMILYRLLSYAWILQCQRVGRETTRQDFEENVEAALNGDDNTFTVSDFAVKFFNPKEIKAIWTGIGVTTKGEDVPRKLRDCCFLSNGFRFDPRMECWVSNPETDRVMSSLMWGSDIDDVRWHLLRACALRIDSYGNLDCRRVLQDYIDWLWKLYSDQMVGGVARSHVLQIPMKDIESVYKTDLWIEALYAGKEAVVHKSTMHGFKNLFLSQLSILSTVQQVLNGEICCSESSPQGSPSAAAGDRSCEASASEEC